MQVTYKRGGMTTETAVRAQRLAFSGQGSEYFRIWIVNLALSILTLGIYSAWAKVRRLKYFYLNTTLADNSFDFHGDPLAILRGRVIAVVLLVAYQLSGAVSPVMALAAMAVLALLYPWLIVRSLRFKLHNSSYRGLRFSFRGDTWRSYLNFLLFPALALFTLYLLAPLAHQRIKRFQHGNSWYANTQFAFRAGSGRFFVLYLKLLGLFVLLVILSVLAATALKPYVLSQLGGLDKDQYKLVIMYSIMAVYLLSFLLLSPWFSARLQNLVWSSTTLGPHAFHSNVRARALLWIYLTNFLGIVATLGLYKPFADIRLARYRLGHIALQAGGPLEDFLADQQQDVTATGEEAADLFDFDISF
jgi:uncharacterized membrane protein YjgN (DUF898 family)